MRGILNPPFMDFNSWHQLLRNVQSYHYTVSDFTTAVAGTGAATLYPNGIDLRTGATSSSEGRAFAALDGLQGTGTVGSRIDFTYPLLMTFWLTAEDSNAAFQRYVQVKAATTHGALGAHGIGVTLENLTLSGESYGVARGAVSLGAITAGRPYKILIAHLVSRIEFWVNGSLSGTQSTANNIPSGNDNVAKNWVATIGNHAASASGKLFAGAFALHQKATT